ncbi:MAG: hypothetical protein MJ175_09945 [Clostridia bacterium]|nr:hypothetical protein [Clostridia bacterium]
MSNRMNRKRLNIGAYILQEYAQTERHIREVKECGIDLIIGMDNYPEVLDLFEKYGVGAVVGGVLPGWWGGNGERAGRMHEINPMYQYELAAANFKDHPAIWGIDVGDEPSALDFPYYSKVIRRVGELFPSQFVYLNLYPNYASVSQNTADQTVSQLGTATYEEHIESYCRNVPSDYICYDFYLYSINVPKAYENLRVVADACLRTGRSMWIVLQVNSNKPAEWISENELRFQAYTAMAFGAETITWACYTAGWWHNQVLDENGEKTEQYAKLQKVNAELHAIGEPYMRYRRTATHFVGFNGTKWLDGTQITPVDSLDTGFFTDVKEADGNPIVVGEMTAREGSGHALMICAAEDPYDKAPTMRKIRFRAAGSAVRVFGGHGIVPVCKLPDGSYETEVMSCDGILIETL